ncbi:hypothetical protein [Moraxella lacunata]|uniref:hypothetical protein n=1 Tax=Moraxella lacunata TaxID=477 RepID=UPI003EE1D67F
MSVTCSPSWAGSDWAVLADLLVTWAVLLSALAFMPVFLGLADLGAGADSAVGMMASAVKSLSRLILPIKASKPRFVPSPRFFVMPIYTSVTENSRVFYHK